MTAPSMLATRASSVSAEWPSVSVIIAARNAASTLGSCLASLAAVDYPDFEVLVADDGSTDATAEIARTHGVRVVSTGGTGPGAARNAAARTARGSVLAFTDADCTVPPIWLRALVRELLGSGAAGVGGRQRNVFPREATSEEQVMDAFFRLASIVADYTRTDDRARRVHHVASCNSAYHRAAFESVGGFAEDLFPSEDVEFDFRLGRTGHFCYYAPDAVVFHRRPAADGWFGAMMFRYGCSAREVVRRHGYIRVLYYVPYVLAAGVLVHGLYVLPQARLPLLALDAAGLLAVLFLIRRAARPALWPRMIWLALAALFEWHRGFLGLGRPPRP